MQLGKTLEPFSRFTCWGEKEMSWIEKVFSLAYFKCGHELFGMGAESFQFTKNKDQLQFVWFNAIDLPDEAEDLDFDDEYTETHSGKLIVKKYIKREGYGQKIMVLFEGTVEEWSKWEQYTLEGRKVKNEMAVS